MTSYCTLSSVVIGAAAWGPVLAFEPGNNLTSIIIALLGLIPILFGIRHQRRESRRPPAAPKSDPDVTIDDRPHSSKPPRNPRAEHNSERR
jgi:hypothetical protein